MTQLPSVTLVIIDTHNHGRAILALNKTLEQIRPVRTIFFTNIDHQDERVEVIKIEPIKSKKQYSEFVIRSLHNFIYTSHVLLIQYDGFVLNGESWTDEFLQYDYIGAPWTYNDDQNVGNGGFSLRSHNLMHTVATDSMIWHSGAYHPEDQTICRTFRHYLEGTYHIKFAPEELAHQFAFELHQPRQKTFGFHNHFWPPYRPPIIIRRTAAMGDVIMVEPVLHHLYEQGHRIILDTMPSFYNLFDKHYFPIELLDDVARQEDVSNYQMIDLDMAYETNPESLVLATYYRNCGIKDGAMRNSKLNMRPTAESKLFDKYVIIHLDDTNMPHRNMTGVNWGSVVKLLSDYGYEVFQMSKREPLAYVAPKINAANEQMLAYIIAGADLFIGLDSGPSQIAVATGVPAMIFFGSVNPEYRYADLSKIKVMQSKCDKQNCYHKVVSTVGQPCVYNEKVPPCTVHDTMNVLQELETMLQ